MLGPTMATATTESTTLLAHDPTTRATAKHGKKSNPKPGMSKSDLVKDCEKLTESEDITQWSDLPAPIKKAAWDLSVCPSGKRLLEKVLSECRTSVQIQVLEQLRGRVWEASTSREANYIIQFCIEVLPSEHLQFVVEEIKDCAVTAAKNRFAVRVVQRLIEFCTESQTSSLVDELISRACDLCCHNSGNYVIQHLLEFGTDQQRHRLATRLANDNIFRFAKDKVGNHVVSCALANCDTHDAQMLAKALKPNLASLSRNCNGSFITKQLRRVMEQSQDAQKD